MARYISPKDTATQVRRALREAHPGVKFSVRTSTYAGGASIQVTYTDGPPEESVKKITDQFEGSHFDGMADILNPVTRIVDGEEVNYLADFVFVTHHTSPAREEAIRAHLADSLGVDRVLDGEWYSASQIAPICEATGQPVRDGLTGYGLIRILAEHPEAIDQSAA